MGAVGAIIVYLNIEQFLSRRRTALVLAGLFGTRLSSGTPQRLPLAPPEA
jgi:hypothetical protein